MAHVRLTEHYDAPIERVFELGTDFKRYPEWHPNYTFVGDLSGPPMTVGTTFPTTMRLMGRTMEGTAEIVESDPPRMLKMAGRSKDGGTVAATYHLTPAGAGTDQVIEIDYELPAGLFGQIVDKLFIERAVERDLRHALENFKALLEVKAPVFA